MKIHSKFKDYYDVCQSYGTDSQHRYIRELQVLPVPDCLKSIQIGGVEKWCGGVLRNFSGNGDYRTLLYVGFCGELHVGLGKWDWDGKLKGVLWNTDVISELERLLVESSLMRYNYFGKQQKAAINEISEYITKDWTNLFIEVDAPIFVYDYTYNLGGTKTPAVIKNPCLRDYGFISVKDPFTAYQEISMFIGNELAKQVDPAPLSDKDRLVAHGMDPVWSFRNPEPPKRKRK